MKQARYFVDAEFRKCVPSCSIEDMDEEFLFILDNIRKKAGIPLVLNSAFRSPAYEKKMGRTGTSAHTYGKAVDIRCSTSSNRMKIVSAAIACGITRIGIGKNFVHIDSAGKAENLPEGVMFHYYE